MWLDTITSYIYQVEPFISYTTNQSINQSIYSSSPMLEVAGNSILSMYNIVSLKVERNDNIAGSHHAVYYNLYI